MTGNIIPTIRLVSFDIWDTLLKSNPNYRDRRTDVIGRNLIGEKYDPIAVNAAVAEVKRIMDDNAVSDGKQYGFLERINAIYEMLDPAIRIPELTDEVRDRVYEQKADIMRQYPPVLLEECIPAVFQSLKRILCSDLSSMKIALISNTGFIDGVHMRVALETLGLMQYVDYALFSNEINMSKPNPEVFQMLMQQSGLKPQNILHVGDNHKADYGGATAVGAYALHLNTKTDALPETETIRSLVDVMCYV